VSISLGQRPARRLDRLPGRSEHLTGLVRGRAIDDLGRPRNQLLIVSPLSPDGG